jgi:hypothetical protein
MVRARTKSQVSISMINAYASPPFPQEWHRQTCLLMSIEQLGVRSVCSGHRTICERLDGLCWTS